MRTWPAASWAGRIRAFRRHPSRVGTCWLVTLHPDLLALGQPDLLAGIDPGCDELPQLVLAAIHEAGHAIARLHQNIAGGDLVARADGTGRSHGGGGPVPTRWMVPVTMAGPLAEAELVVRTSGDGARRDVVYWLGSADGDLADLRRVPAFWVDTLDEAVTLALLRGNWTAVLRVAAALLATPDHRLTWDQQITAAGTVLEADDDLVIELLDLLGVGDIDSLVGRVGQQTTT